MATFTLQRTTPADMETVFAVLTDHRGYADITAVRKAVLEREGTPAPNGVGAIRKLSLAGPPLREEVTGYDAPSRFEYRLLSGLPVRDHVGTVTLSHSGGGTNVSYRIDSTPTLPIGGGALVAVLKGVIGLLLRDVVKEAERRAPATA